MDQWRNRKVKGGPSVQQIELEAGTFFGEVRVHYERLDKRIPAHDLDK